MIHVGADVHVRNTVFKAIDNDGRVLARGRAHNTLLGVAAVLGPIEELAHSQGEAVRVVMESTTNSRPIKALLEQYGCQAGIDLTAEVLHARKLRIIAESVNKSDRVDTDALTDLSRSNLQLPVCYVPDDEEFALREHLRARADLVAMRTMLKNRAHAVLHRRGVLTPQGDLFTKTGRQFLEQLDLDSAGREILDRFLAGIDRLNESIEASTASLRSLARQERWARSAALLQSIPGIGLITALTILAELGDIKRFRGRAGVANYAGLVPRHRSSDQRHWSGGITHRGPGHLRAMLAEAAWIAMPKVPVYTDLFERVAAKKGRRAAIVAVARRLLEDAWTMLRKDEPFRYVPPPGPQAADARVDRKIASSLAG